MAKDGKYEEEPPTRLPPEWEPQVYACPDGYQIAGYDGYGNPICELIPVYVDPTYPPVGGVITCPPGSSWDALRGVCVSNPDTRPLECATGYYWDTTQGACVPIPTLGGDLEEVLYPVDCQEGYHSIMGTNGQPICVTDVPQTVGGGGTTTTPGVKTGGILDGILDANGKLFGFEPIYVIGAAVVALFLFSGGGKR